MARPPLIDPSRLPVHEESTWPSLVASGVLHVAVLVLTFLILHREQEEAKAHQRPESQPKQVEMVYLPQPKQPKPLPKPEPPPPPQQSRPVTPHPDTPTPQKQSSPLANNAKREEKDPNAVPDAQPQRGPEEPQQDLASKATPDAGAEKQVPKTSPSDAPFASQEAEAKRLFGPQGRRADADANQFSVRPFSMPGQPSEKCEPVPRFKRDSLGRAPMGVAIGRILRDDNGKPLAGALLQMVGTPYVTFTDDNGEYKFTFDMGLIEDCRTQFARVSAKGYESRLLVLQIGERIRSEDVSLRRSNGLPFNIRPGGRN